jgi:hypothetical protein
MSSYAHFSDTKFGFIAGFTLVAASILFVATAVQIGEYARTRAVTVSDGAQHFQINPELGYQAALLMDPGNTTYRNHLAEYYLQTWQPDRVANLFLKHEGDDTSLLLRSRALLEQDKADEAVLLPANNDDGLLQKALALSVAGERSSTDTLAAADTNKRVTAQIERVSHGGLPLAQELWSHGMPQASLRILEKTEPSVERYRLQAELELARPQGGSEALSRASEAISRGIELDPSYVALHELKMRLFERTDDKAGAKAENEVIQRLRQGQF